MIERLFTQTYTFGGVKLKLSKMMMLVVEWAFWSKDENLATHLHYQRIEAEPWILTFHAKECVFSVLGAGFTLLEC